MKKYKVGIIGVGNIFLNHYNAIQKSKNFSIKGINDLTKIFSNKYYFKNRDNIFKSKNIDLISVLTPSGNHFTDTVQSLKNNKHVIVEKPLSLKLEHLNKIVKLEKKFNKKVFIVFQHRLNPSIIELKKCLYQRKIGKVFLVSSRLYWSRNDNYFKKSNWRGTWKYDGGVATNQGIHTIDIILELFGEPKSVFARSNKISKYVEADDFCTASVLFKSGVVCNMEFTTAVRPSNLDNSIMVLGSKGYFHINGKNFNQYTSSLFKKKKLINTNNLYSKYYDKIYRCLSKKEKNNFSAKSSVKSLKLLIAINQSIKSKKEIKYPISNKIKIKLGV
tara:strand:+ start:9165 stop:10160 length:996 start_codon:yes stop_codon:yes gene_type:complete